MVLLALCIVAIISVIIVQVNENAKTKEPEPPKQIATLKPEFNEEMKEMIMDLEKKAARLQELSNEGMKLYNGLPAGLKECEKLKTLDDSNWALFGAQTHIETAISRIKDAMI